MLNPQQATLIMQYLMGGLLALIPLLAWGYIFYQKKTNKLSKKHILISFAAGVFSVIPIFVVLGDLGTVVFSFGPVEIQGLQLYHHIENLATNPGPLSFVTYIIASILVFLSIYVIAGVITFILEITTGGGTVKTFKTTLKKSFEAPFITITLGIIIGLLAYYFHWSLHEVFWKSMMIGVVEEYTKHLLVRFTNEDDFRSIADVILYSILVALGFAFFENILYFVDKIWLTPCSAIEIQQGFCLFNDQTGYYVPQVGVLLAPFVFRSIFSTLAHILFSGIFGYFYGMAYFANSTPSAACTPTPYQSIRTKIHQILHCRKEVLFHQRKILEGAVLAMGFHGLFNFFLDEQVYHLTTNHFYIGPVFIIIPALILGYMYISYQLQRPEHQQLLLPVPEKVGTE